jgi:hypothetical protein
MEVADLSTDGKKIGWFSDRQLLTFYSNLPPYSYDGTINNWIVSKDCGSAVIMSMYMCFYK